MPGSRHTQLHTEKLGAIITMDLLKAFFFLTGNPAIHLGNTEGMCLFLEAAYANPSKFGYYPAISDAFCDARGWGRAQPLPTKELS